MERILWHWRQPLTRIVSVVTLFAVIFGTGAYFVGRTLRRKPRTHRASLATQMGRSSTPSTSSSTTRTTIAIIPTSRRIWNRCRICSTSSPRMARSLPTTTTILISHTAGGILSSLTGLYPDRQGQTVSNSYDYFSPSGNPSLHLVLQVLDGPGGWGERFAAQHGYRRPEEDARAVGALHPRWLRRRWRRHRQHRVRIPRTASDGDITRVFGSRSPEATRQHQPAPRAD